MAERVRNKKGLSSVITKVLLDIVIFFVAIIALFLLFYVFSAQLHKGDSKYKPFISFYTIVSPSMNPVIKVYDVVINKRVRNPNDIEVGDIITYISTNSTSEGMTITHRVVSINKIDNGNYEYQTQGDNNSEPDGVLVTFDNVIGKEIAIVPKLGKIQFLLANKKGWFVLLLIPILIFVIKDIYDLIGLFGLRRKVDDVLGYIEEPVYVKKHEKEEQAKEILKRELSIRKVKEDALIRKPDEGEGFLEPYTEETIVVGKIDSIGKEDAVEPMKIVKTDKIEGIKVVANTDNDEFNKKVEDLDVVKSPIEVLDTDDLSKTIKIYDDKIAKLNEVLVDLEQMKANKAKIIRDEKDKVNKELAIEKEKLSKEIAIEKEKARKEIDEEKKEAYKEIEEIKNTTKKTIKSNPKKIVDKYLIGKKIKVVNTEQVKRNNKKVDNKERIVLGNSKVTLNNRRVIERPISTDLPKMNKVEDKADIVVNKPIVENRDLNLRDNKVVKEKKKISSQDVVLKDINTLSKKVDKDLLFNPKMVKKVETKDKDDSGGKKKKKKKGLIFFEKIK